MRSPTQPPHDLVAEGRLVRGGWGIVLSLAALLAVAVLATAEAHWRGRGVEPSVSSVGASWNVARDRVEPDSLVLVGTSKMQSALDPVRLGAALGRQPAIQLALIDRSPLPVLEQLAADESFAGKVVVDVAPRIFFDATGGRERAASEILEAWAAYRTSPGDRVEARLRILAENALVMRRPAFSLRRLVDIARGRDELRLPFARVRLDRFRAIDFGLLPDLASRRRSQAVIVARSGRAANEAERDALIQRVGAAARAIEARGGAVILTLLPVSGAAREAEERRFPRASTWDVLVRRTGLTALHFADHPELAAFECPDGLHLDVSQAAAFTETFAALLGSRPPS